jgi:hypothetical protein
MKRTCIWHSLEATDVTFIYAYYIAATFHPFALFDPNHCEIIGKRDSVIRLQDPLLKVLLNVQV